MLSLVSLVCSLASIFSSHWFYPDQLEAWDHDVRIWNNLLHPLVSTYVGYKPLFFPRIKLSNLDVLQERHRAHEALVCFSLVAFVSLFTLSCNIFSHSYLHFNEKIKLLIFVCQLLSKRGDLDLLLSPVVCPKVPFWAPFYLPHTCFYELLENTKQYHSYTDSMKPYFPLFPPSIPPP